MEDVRSLDERQLYDLLMRGASTVWQVEAAERLVFQAPVLREWLIAHGFIRLEELNGLPCAATFFTEAVDFLAELAVDGRRLAAEGPGASEAAVLRIAASLSGADVGTLRHVMPDLAAEHARLVAESVMYAAGFMDGSADPEANEVDGFGTGPNAQAHRRRLMS